MSTETTRKEILDLLAQGKITAMEASEMLSATTAVAPPAQPAPPTKEAQQEEEPVSKADRLTEPDTNGKQPSWLRVRVRNLQTGKSKVSVNIPLTMVHFGLQFANRFNSQQDDFNLHQWSDMLFKAEQGILVDVEDAESNEHVQIYLD